MSKKKTPGMLVKSLCIDNLGLSIAEAAKLLKMTRANLYLLINGKTAISPDMALRLEAVFNLDAKKLFFLQCEHDFELARKKKLNLQRIGKGKIKVPKLLDL